MLKVVEKNAKKSIHKNAKNWTNSHLLVKFSKHYSHLPHETFPVSAVKIIVKILGYYPTGSLFGGFRLSNAAMSKLCGVSISTVTRVKHFFENLNIPFWFAVDSDTQKKELLKCNPDRFEKTNLSNLYKINPEIFLNPEKVLKENFGLDDT